MFSPYYLLSGSRVSSVVRTKNLINCIHPQSLLLDASKQSLEQATESREQRSGDQSVCHLREQMIQTALFLRQLRGKIFFPPLGERINYSGNDT